jgi:hypothetical protein
VLRSFATTPDRHDGRATVQILVRRTTALGGVLFCSALRAIVLDSLVTAQVVASQELFEGSYRDHTTPPDLAVTKLVASDKSRNRSR